MADYYAHCRSNYFLVKDQAAFDAWIDLFDGALEAWRDDDGANAISSAFDGGWPSVRHPMPPHHVSQPLQDPTDDVSVTCQWEDCDIVEELATHLAPGHVAVLQEVGYEKLRYLIGHAVAVNAAGDVEVIGLDDIYERAKRLGPHITQAYR